MGQIHRPWPGRNDRLSIDVRLLQDIEEATMIDSEPPPSVIAPLVARLDAERNGFWRRVDMSDELAEDIHNALDPYGAFLDLEEIHAVQRLRGWNRARYGSITVAARWLTAVRNLLDDLTLSLGDSCEDEFQEISQEHEWDLYVQVAARLFAGKTCGECNWCTALRLRDECDTALDAAGHEGGIYYRVYCLGQSVDEANAALHGADWRHRMFGSPRAA